MTMAKYIRGPRLSVQHLPGSTVNAGDVVVQGQLALVADLDNPEGTGLSILQMALWLGGVYQCVADAAYANSTYVWINTTTGKITTTQTPGQTFPFGFLVGGPSGLLSDGGPTGNNSVCFVAHSPFPSMPEEKFVSSAASNATAAAGDITGANSCDLTLTANGANAYTTRTATQMFGDMNAQVGQSYHLRIRNTGNNTATLTAGVGVTITGTMTIRSNSYRDFIVTFNTTTTLTIQDLGSPADDTLGILGVAAGYKVARGQHQQVAASDTIVTGLATVVAVVASWESAPTLKQMFVRAAIGDQAGTPAAGSILLNTYKPTANNDVTPIAATDFTDNLKINWIAIGT